jgi:hypothetical protein
MSTNKSIRFDKYIPLFGRDNDLRVRVMLHELEWRAEEQLGFKNPEKNFSLLDSTSRYYNDIVLDANRPTPLMRKEIFEVPSAYNDIHPTHSEWHILVTDICKRLYDIAQGATTNSDLYKQHVNKVLDIVVDIGKELKDISNINKLPGLISNLIRRMGIQVFSGVPTALVEITDTPQTWTNATSLRFPPVNTPPTSIPSPNPNLGNCYVNGTLFFNFKSVDTVDSGRVMFNYNHIKLYNSILSEENLKMSVPKSAVSSLLLDSPPNATYVRDDNGVLCEVVNGKLEPVFVNSERFNKIFNEAESKGRCATTGLKMDNDTCQMFIVSCLRTGDQGSIDKCRNIFVNPNFYDISLDEVNNLVTPQGALSVLKAASWEFEEVHDNVAKMNLVRPCTVDEWLSTVKSKLTGDATAVEGNFNHIRTNTKLLNYLGLLVEKVRNNPAIINKKYKVSPTEAYLKDESHKNTFLKSIGVLRRPRVKLGLISRIDNIYKYHQDYLNRLRFINGIRVGVVNSPGGLIPIHQYGNGQNGGNPLVLEQLKNMQLNEHKISNVVSSLYNSLKASLSRQSKNISNEDNQKIVDLISNLHNTENKLLKTMIYIQKYVDLLELFGESDFRDTLSVDQVQKFVDTRDKYFDRVVRRNDDIFNVLRSIANNVNLNVNQVSTVQPITVVRRVALSEIPDNV